MERIRVLLIEDNPADARLIREMLAEGGGVAFDVEWRDDLAKGMRRLGDGGMDVVLLDLTLPDSRGFNTFSTLQTAAPRLPVVIVTGLDDETVAIRAVRGGAQDYLVKGRVTGDQLTRAIRYAIARKTGEKRAFLPEELRGFDGKEGRPAYVAYGGKVYDLSDSSLWAEGVHSGAHSAGSDLSSEMGNAPHGEEALLKFHIVGELAEERTLAHWFVQRAEALHLHPILAHFSVAYPIAFASLSVLYLFTGAQPFEAAAFYMLVSGFATSLLATASGIFSWKVTYGGKRNKIFDRKLIFTALFMAFVAACVVWRTLSPDILTAMTGESYVYLALVLAQVPLVTILGYYGGKIVFT